MPARNPSESVELARGIVSLLGGQPETAQKCEISAALAAVASGGGHWR